MPSSSTTSSRRMCFGRAFLERAAVPVEQVPPHRQVREQARFLEDVADRALVRLEERGGRVVLPDVAADDQSAGQALSPATQRRIVVLPQPDGPNSAVIPRIGASNATSSAKLPSTPA